MSRWLPFLVAMALLAGVPLAYLAMKRFRIARQRAFVRSAFKQYLSPDVVEELVRAPSRDWAPEPRTVSFIVLQVRDDDVENVQKRLARALPIVINAEGWIVEHMAASLVIATSGALQLISRGPIAEDRALLASRLMSELGSEIRLVHGSAVGLVGNFGTGTKVAFGTVWPDFGEMLGRLLQLDFGQSAEVAPALT